MTLGKMGPVLKQVEDSIFRLNQIYRKLLVLTGANPDRFRDYNLAGIESDRPFEGVNIIVTTYTDGSRTSTKVLR